MAKRALRANDLIVDRVMLVAILSLATSYVMRGTWASVFFETAAIVLGIVWSVRAMTTNPSKTFRLMALLVLVLLATLLSFYIAAAHNVL